MPILVGPFSQLIPLSKLPPCGPIKDSELELITDGGIVFEKDKILEVDAYKSLSRRYSEKHIINYPAVAMPGLIDAHTHICYAGSRAADYAERLNGRTYQEIAAKGGGIMDTVRQTRAASTEELADTTLKRAQKLLSWGVTTCEVKSGYGLSVKDEVKMFDAMHLAANKSPLSIIPTCLAAHVRPEQFNDNQEYLSYLATELLPLLSRKKLTQRIDIFVDNGAFTVEEARKYLRHAKKMGFQIVVHADQFCRGGASLAAELHALSADHLEASQNDDLAMLKKANVIPIVLPGASVGLGMAFPPARLALDIGLPLVIASDWNPGSAPMGNLLALAALLGAAQKLTMAETLAAITTRAAHALALKDRGELSPGKQADMAVFPCSDYREVLYQQGSLTPANVVIKGKLYQLYDPA